MIMKPQEWLDWHDNFTFHPEYDPYFVTKVRTAATIIREQQERIERLTAKIAELKAVDHLYKIAKTWPEYEFAHQRWFESLDALFAELEGK